MSKSKHREAIDKLAASTTLTPAINLTWQGLRTEGFNLAKGSDDQKNMASQYLAAAILGLLAERPVTFEYDDGHESGDLDTLADYWRVNVWNAAGDKKRFASFRSAVLSHMIVGNKPEKPVENKVSVDSADYRAEQAVYNKKLATLARPFDLAAAMVSKGYDAGNFVIKEGFSIERKDMVPPGFTLDRFGTDGTEQAEKDVISLSYKSQITNTPGRIAKSNERETICRNIKSKSLAYITHTVEKFMLANKPESKGGGAVMTLDKALGYVAGVKETPRLTDKQKKIATTALAVLSRIVEFNNQQDALAAAATVETDGKGNVKAA